MTDRSPRSTRSYPRALLVGLLAVSMVTIGLTATVAAQQTDDERTEDPVFTAPRRAHRLVGDPWIGGAWIGSFSSGLFLATFPDGDATQPADALRHYGIRDGLPHAQINAIAPTPKRVFVGTEAGLAVLDKATNEIQRIEHPDGDPLDARVFGLHPEGDTVWVGTFAEGMYRLSVPSMTLRAVDNPDNGSAFEDPVMGFAHRGEDLFISAARYGLIRWDRENGDTQRYNDTFRLEEPLYRDVILTEDRVWVGTSGDGVISYDIQTGEGAEYSGGRSYNNINAWGIAETGTEVWVGGDSGTARYRIADDEWDNWQANSGYRWGTTRDIALIEGHVFSLSEGGVIGTYDRNEDRWVQAGWFDNEATPPWTTMTGCTSFQDRLVFTTGARGSTYFDPSTGRWPRVGDEPQATGEAPSGLLHWDPASDDDTLVIGAGKGLYRYAADENRWTRIPLDEDDTRYNPRDVDLQDDAIWIATDARRTAQINPDWLPGYIGRWDGGSESWTRWGPSEGLSGANATEVLVQVEQVWAGLEANGIDVIDRETDEITHVYPDGDRAVTVHHMVEHDGAVWAATSDGVLRIDPATHAVEAVAGLDTFEATELHWRNGTLYVGGAFTGLTVWEPDAAGGGEVTRYTIDHAEDIYTRCMVEHDGVLYLGTHRGVDRFLPDWGLFLTYGAKIGGQTRLDEGPQANLAIHAPAENATVPAEEPLAVEGNATGPDAGLVQVQVAGSGWATASQAGDGSGAWSVEVDLPAGTSGRSTVLARLVADGTVLAQDARTVHVERADDAGQRAPDVRVSHAAAFTLTRAEPAPIRVTAEPAPANLTATVHLEAPGADEPRQLALGPSDDGVLTGQLPALDETGEGSYRIEVRWDGGSAHLPAAHSGFGRAYPLVVQEIQGIVSGHLSGLPDELALAPGEERTLRVILQNTGSRPGTFVLSLEGSGAAWFAGSTDSVSVDPGTSQTVTYTVAVPEDTDPGRYEVSIAADPTDLGMVAGTEATLPIEVTTQGAGQGGDGAGGTDATPGPSVILAAAAAALAALARRRRR